MMFRIGTVVASYPQANSVDVLLDDDGNRLSNVQVLAIGASSKTGMLDLPDVGGPLDGSRWDPTVSRSLYIKAVVGFFGNAPFVIGFLLPQVNQITFQEKNRRIVRHASDVYTTVDDAGNMEVSHPSGTFIRIGTSAAHEDLTGKDFDGKWAIARNTDKAVNLQITVKNGGTQKASINIDPSGNVTVSHTGNLSITAGGNTSINTSGTTSITSTGNATVHAPQVTIDSPQTTCTGALTVQGLLTYQGGMAGSGGTGGSSATITGNVTITSGNVVADGIGLKTHHHGGVQTGTGNTGGPSG